MSFEVAGFAGEQQAATHDFYPPNIILLRPFVLKISEHASPARPEVSPDSPKDVKCFTHRAEPR